MQCTKNIAGMEITMDKSRKKVMSAFMIMLVIAAVAVAGYYTINKQITQEAEEKVSLPDTETGKLLSKDLEVAYPKTPTEVVKLYWRLNQCMYNDDMSDKDFEGLLKQLRKLYDKELLDKKENSWENMLSSFKADKKKYSDNKQKISLYMVQENSAVEFGKQNGRDCAILFSSTMIKQKSATGKVYEKFMCRKDSSGEWRILGWSKADKEAKKYFDN